MSDMATVFVSGIRSLDADALLSAFNMESSLLDANINAIASLFNRELHFINVNDEDYVRLVCDARLTGERWKARTRDMKGQFCRTKYQANVVWGWSHRIYDWTVVLPWSFGQMLAPLAAQINSVACKDTRNLRRLDAHAQDLQRDFSSTVNRRAHDRSLTTRVHRQHLTGRRNRFVAVPKVVH